MATPAIKNEDIIQIYLLFYQKVGARPEVVPCSEIEVLQHQAVQIILNSKKLEPRFHLAIEKLVESGLKGNFQRIMETFRMAQANQGPLGFDIWWDDEPQVLL